jgi:hypothetical protein
MRAKTCIEGSNPSVSAKKVNARECGRLSFVAVTSNVLMDIAGGIRSESLASDSAARANGHERSECRECGRVCTQSHEGKANLEESFAATYLTNFSMTSTVQLHFSTRATLIVCFASRLA